MQIDLYLCLWTTYFENRYSNCTTVDRKIWEFFWKKTLWKKTLDTLIWNPVFLKRNPCSKYQLLIFLYPGLLSRFLSRTKLKFKPFSLQQLTHWMIHFIDESSKSIPRKWSDKVDFRLVDGRKFRFEKNFRKRKNECPRSKESQTRSRRPFRFGSK